MTFIKRSHTGESKRWTTFELTAEEPTRTKVKWLLQMKNLCSAGRDAGAECGASVDKRLSTSTTKLTVGTRLPAGTAVSMEPSEHTFRAGAAGRLRPVCKRASSVGRSTRVAAPTYSAAAVAGCGCPSFGPVRAFCSSSQRLWCSRAQLTSTSPEPMASKAPSIPMVPI